MRMRKCTSEPKEEQAQPFFFECTAVDEEKTFAGLT